VAAIVVSAGSGLSLDLLVFCHRLACLHSFPHRDYSNAFRPFAASAISSICPPLRRTLLAMTGPCGIFAVYVAYEAAPTVHHGTISQEMRWQSVRHSISGSRSSRREHLSLSSTFPGVAGLIWLMEPPSRRIANVPLCRPRHRRARERSALVPSHQLHALRRCLQGDITRTFEWADLHVHQERRGGTADVRLRRSVLSLRGCALARPWPRANPPWRAVGYLPRSLRWSQSSCPHSRWCEKLSNSQSAVRDASVGFELTSNPSSIRICLLVSRPASLEKMHNALCSVLS